MKKYDLPEVETTELLGMLFRQYRYKGIYLENSFILLFRDPLRQGFFKFTS